jgi:AraC-like DNA-binding protein
MPKDQNLNIFQEITPLKNQDVLVVIDSLNNGFDYPIHNHPEYEINLVSGISGTRIVGDSTERYTDQDLVLLGPYLWHKWDGDEHLQKNGQPYRVLTVQFSVDLFNAPFFQKEGFFKIKKLLKESSRGIRFYGHTYDKAFALLSGITQSQGIQGILTFIQLLDLFAGSSEFAFLSSPGFSPAVHHTENTRIQMAYSYIMKNYTKLDFRMNDVAEALNMSESAFSHFFQKFAFRSFTQFLIDLRIGHACKMLLDTDQTIAQISDASGFNNLANFNRLFKKYRDCTPMQYRKRYTGNAQFDWANQLTPWQFVPNKANMNPILKPNLSSTRVIHI